MTDEIHALLGKKYTIHILRKLKEGGPQGFREIDVTVVGSTGSTRSTRFTLLDLIRFGLVIQREPRGKYEITAHGLDVLAYAEQGETLFSLAAAKIKRGALEK